MAALGPPQGALGRARVAPAAAPNFSFNRRRRRRAARLDVAFYLSAVAALVFRKAFDLSAVAALVSRKAFDLSAASASSSSSPRRGRARLSAERVVAPQVLRPEEAWRAAPRPREVSAPPRGDVAGCLSAETRTRRLNKARRYDGRWFARHRGRVHGVFRRYLRFRRAGDAAKRARALLDALDDLEDDDAAGALDVLARGPGGAAPPPRVLVGVHARGTDAADRRRVVGVASYIRFLAPLARTLKGALVVYRAGV